MTIRNGSLFLDHPVILPRVFFSVPRVKMRVCLAIDNLRFDVRVWIIHTAPAALAKLVVGIYRHCLRAKLLIGR